MKKKPPTYPLTKLGRIRDKATETYLDVIEFSVSAQERRKLNIAPSVVSDTAAFGKRLRDAGALLSDETWKDDLQAVARKRHSVEWIFESKTGWSEDRRMFVLTDSAIGENVESVLGVNTTLSDPSGQVGVRGTWKSWRSSVGAIATRSSFWMCTVCTAFAAPLLSLTGIDSYGISGSGPSRSGKSLGTTLASSVIGIGQKERLISWNLTDARLEQRLPEYNDSLFPIDDLQVIKEKDRYARIQHLAYRMAQGQATGRHSSFAQRHGGMAQWRCIVLTSSEVAIQDLARRAGRERQGGEAVRLIDLPVLGEDADHIFDRCDAAEATSTSWRAETFADAAKACSENFGAVYRKYISSLISIGAELLPDVRARIDFFLSKVSEADDSDLARDIARKFALLYAGGMIARRCGIVSWGKADLLDAIRVCYLRARALLPDEGEQLRTGLECLRDKIRSLPIVPAVGGGEFSKAVWINSMGLE